jgi:hypothetical protein
VNGEPIGLSGNNLETLQWIPAFAGMTRGAGMTAILIKCLVELPGEGEGTVLGVIFSTIVIFVDVQIVYREGE